MNKAKLEVSKCIKELNRRYRRNYTMQDLAEKIGVSREALSRATTDSAFSFVYKIAYGLYELYPESGYNGWDFNLYMEYLLWENHEYCMRLVG